MKREKIEAQKRTILGKKVKSLRREGIMPANIYGKTHKSASIQFDQKEFNKIFDLVGETGLVDLVLGKDTIPSLIHNIQKDPKTKSVIHADFLAVNLKEKITAKVPVVSIGESPAVHEKKGILMQPISDIEVEALPADLPEHIEVSVENLTDLNDHILVSDIKPAGNYIILTDPETLVFKVAEIKIEEEPEEAPEEETTGEESQKSEKAPEEAPGQTKENRAEEKSE